VHDAVLVLIQRLDDVAQGVLAQAAVRAVDPHPCKNHPAARPKQQLHAGRPGVVLYKNIVGPASCAVSRARSVSFLRP
jgi:hypothetical protein